MTRKTLLVASLGLALACGAPAAVFSRDAGGDGVNWEDPRNWNANALPGAADLVFSAGNGSTRRHPDGGVRRTRYRIQLPGVRPCRGHLVP